MAKLKYYAVAKGRTTGIFDNWEECQESIKGYKGATYKSFSNTALDLAEQYLIGQGVFTIVHHFNLDLEEKKEELNTVRLIDANKWIRELEKGFAQPNYHPDTGDAFCCMEVEQHNEYIASLISSIQEQPTAFDIEAVKRDLQANSDGYLEGGDETILIDKACDIVEGGGID